MSRWANTLAKAQTKVLISLPRVTQRTSLCRKNSSRAKSSRLSKLGAELAISSRFARLEKSFEQVFLSGTGNCGKAVRWKFLNTFEAAGIAQSRC